MRIVCIADTHELHRELTVPDGDILIHAGDFTFFSKSISKIEDFGDWLSDLPHRHKVVVYGNHEFAFERDPTRKSLLGDAIVLTNESRTVAGLKIFGSPVTPLYGGAFGLSSERDRIKLYSAIPHDVDMVISHGPPYGILDRANESDEHAGCKPLLDAVTRVRPRLHIFGHIHGARGIVQGEHTMFANAAMLDLNAELSEPIVIDLPEQS